MSGLNPTTLATNISDLAARNVEQRVKDLYALLQPAVDDFFRKMGISATFYADGTGASIALHASTKTLLTAMAQANPATGWPATYFSGEETRLGDTIMVNYADDASKRFNIGP